MDNQLIVAIIGFTTSTVAVSLSYYLTKRHQFKMEERRLKEEHYKAFIKALSDLAIENDSDTTQRKFADVINSTLLVGSSEVINNLMKFHDFLRVDATNFNSVDRTTPEWSSRFEKELTVVVKSMRKDLFGGNYDDERVFPTAIHLVGFKPKSQRGY